MRALFTDPHDVAGARAPPRWRADAASLALARQARRNSATGGSVDAPLFAEVLAAGSAGKMLRAG
jgi:hypothetical protein